MINNVLLLCEDLLRQYFPNCIYSVLTGSYAEGTNTERSDIDIIIIQEGRQELIHNINFKGILFEVLSIPKNKLFNILSRDIINKSGIYLGMFQKAIIVRDKDDFILKIVEVSKKRYIQGPLFTINDKLVLKNKISKFKINFEYAKNYLEECFYLNNGIDCLILYYRFKYGVWESKYPSFIQLLNKNETQELEEALKAFAMNNNKQKLLDHFEKILFLIKI